MSTALTCLPAVPGQLDLLLDMEEEYYRLDNLRFDRPSARKAIEDVLFEPSLGRVFVIAEGEQPAGYAILTWCYSIEFRGRFALLDEFFLLPTHRSKGIGTRIFKDFLEPLCRAEGIKAIRLEVEHHNPRAKTLYKRLGFELHTRDIMTKWLQ